MAAAVVDFVAAVVEDNCCYYHQQMNLTAIDFDFDSDSDFELDRVSARPVGPQNWNCSVSPRVPVVAVELPAVMVAPMVHFSVYPIHQLVPCYVYLKINSWINYLE